MRVNPRWPDWNVYCKLGTRSGNGSPKVDQLFQVQCKSNLTEDCVKPSLQSTYILTLHPHHQAISAALNSPKKHHVGTISRKRPKNPPETKSVHTKHRIALNISRILGPIILIHNIHSFCMCEYNIGAHNILNNVNTNNRWCHSSLYAPNKKSWPLLSRQLQQLRLGLLDITVETLILLT